MTDEINENKKLNYQRSCDGCTKCCEGWLSANLHGKQMHRGRKCHFVEVGKGCAIYEDRPENPCKTFLCAWRYDYNLPEWFKPNQSNVICMWKQTLGENPITYLHIVECDTPLDSTVLSWLIHHFINYAYTLHGQLLYVGTPDFLKVMNELYNGR